MTPDAIGWLVVLLPYRSLVCGLRRSRCWSSLFETAVLAVHKRCQAALRVRSVQLVMALAVRQFLTDAARNQNLKTRHTLVVSQWGARPFTTGVSTLDCQRQAHVNAFGTLRLAVISYHGIAITNGIYV